MILVTNNEGTPGVPVTAKLLAEGRPGLDAIEAGIRLVEADETIRTVGRGGWPNLLGEVELDAAMMHGGSLRSGATIQRWFQGNSATINRQISAGSAAGNRDATCESSSDLKSARSAPVERQRIQAASSQAASR